MSAAIATVGLFLKESQATCHVAGCTWTWKDGYPHATVRARRARQSVYEHLFLRHNIGAMEATVETIDYVRHAEGKKRGARKARTSQQA